jgi:hypothetical protein
MIRAENLTKDFGESSSRSLLRRRGAGEKNICAISRRRRIINDRHVYVNGNIRRPFNSY